MQGGQNLAWNVKRDARLVRAEIVGRVPARQADYVPCKVVKTLDGSRRGRRTTTASVTLPSRAMPSRTIPEEAFKADP